ncbi:MAG TPA: AlkA N-terminal domain-containing protein [Patescibacteria group bacterium]|nr:AlkA N-terminal domain-containing protein [Patescibacteria group bacterium]
MPAPAPYYKALSARDPRFDGVFFVGVASTGIYCRPICPAKTPKAENCRFFDNAQAAEAAGFRPCLRCRPELAPGYAPVDDSARIARLIAARFDENMGLEEIAAQFELSTRQIRRIVQKEMGVSPARLLLSRRLLLAKQLLTDTAMPVTDIAFASGFRSLRRFNDAFARHYRMPPRQLRRKAQEGMAAAEGGTALYLGYRPPYDWAGILAFLRHRALKGAEYADETFYSRTVQIAGQKGWLRVTHAPARNALRVEFPDTLLPVLPALLGRVRNLFDLDARPDLIAAHFDADEVLGKMVRRNPGQRVPGAFDVFELGIRAILGQQVTVKAATTLGGRFMERFGEPIATPIEGLTHIAPRPEEMAKFTVEDIAALGINGARAKSILSLAAAFASGDLRLEPGVDPATAIQKLDDLPGIGPWTANYIAMRALRWPDAFPTGDIGVMNNLGGVTAKEADRMAERWRPWRSYAVLHLWHNPLK